MTARPAAGPDSDARLVRVLDSFLKALEAGAAPSEEELLALHPELAEDLRECLASLEFIRRAAVTSGPATVGTDPSGLSGPAGAVLGDFRILREVGRGGMGVVYQAVQVSLGRRVALKVLPFAATLDPRQLQRFENEARAAAQLHHSHVVPVFAVGQDRNVHYYAMQFIDGHSLAAVIQDLRRRKSGRAAEATLDPDQTGPFLPDEPVPATVSAAFSTEGPDAGREFFRTAARLGLEAAEALEHAHQMGVIHRDVKPANLMVDGRGHLWVTDFGLAHCQGNASLTVTGDLVGTLRYVSPEQAVARRGAVDHRTDVYSLGVTLYELLTLEPAFAGRDRRELLRQILQDEPRPPRQFQKAVPRELEVIVLKASAKTPEERYGTAQDLADDLRRFLEDRPILARPPTPWQRARKWGRRHRPLVIAAVAATAVLLVMALGFAGVLLWQWHQQTVAALGYETQMLYQKTKALNDLEAEKHETDLALKREKATAYVHRILLARRDWATGNLANARQLLEGCEPELRRWEWHYLWQLCQSRVRTLRVAGGKVLYVAYSPDGSRLAAASKQMVQMWDTGSGDEVFVLTGDTRPVGYVTFRPDGKLLASVDVGGVVRFWDVATGRDAGSLPGTGPGSGMVAFSPDGLLLASIHQKGMVKVWDTAGRKELRTLAESTFGPVAFSPDGRYLVANSRMGLKLWDVATWREERTFANSGGRVVGELVFSPDGRYLACSAPDDVAKVWDVSSGSEYLSWRGQRPTGGVAFSPDGRYLALPLMTGETVIRDVSTGREVRTLRRQGTGMNAAFSPDGRELAFPSGGGDEPAVHFHELNWSSLGRVYGRTGSTGTPVISPDGRRSAWLEKNVITILDDAGSELRRITIDGRPALTIHLLFSDDGRRLAATLPPSTEGGPSEACVWDLDVEGEPIRLPFKGPIGPAVSSRDGRRLAFQTGGVEGGARMVDIQVCEVGKEPVRLAGRLQAPVLMAFHPDGLRLAVGDVQGTVRIWDVSAQKEIRELRSRSRGGLTLAFSGDGRRLAGVGRDGLIIVWDADSGDEVLQLDQATNPTVGIKVAALNSRGDRLAVGGVGEPVRIWDATSGRELLTLDFPEIQIFSLAFTADDGRLVGAGRTAAPEGRSSGSAGAIVVWNAADERPSSQKLDQAVWHDQMASLAETSGQWFAAGWHLDRLLTEQPKDATLRGRRAWIHAELGQWDRAAAESAEAVALRTDPADLERAGWHVAWLRIFWGDAAERRRLCTAVLERQAQVVSPLMAGRAARLCVLLPDSVEDAATAVRLARRAADAQQANAFYWGTLALAHYRQGDWKAASQALEKAAATRKPGEPEPLEELLIRAMTRWHQDERDQARRDYDQAARWLDDKEQTRKLARPNYEQLSRLRAEAAALLKAP